MSVVKLYGVPMTTCTKRVAAILREKNVPYELIIINITAKEHLTPEYLEKQPFAQIPYLDDNGYRIYESRAIARYIALKYAKQGTQGLIPDQNDFEAMGKFEEACSLEYAHFNPPAEGLIAELIFSKYNGEETDPVAVAEHTATLTKKLDAYDQILSKRRYLTGDHITLADFFHLPYAALIVDALKSDVISSRPNVCRWWNDISSRESWKAVKDNA